MSFATFERWLRIAIRSPLILIGLAIWVLMVFMSFTFDFMSLRDSAKDANQMLRWIIFGDREP